MWIIRRFKKWIRTLNFKILLYMAIGYGLHLMVEGTAALFAYKVVKSII